MVTMWSCLIAAVARASRVNRVRSRCIGDLRPDDFQGDGSGEETVFGQEDKTHAALAQEPQNAIVGQPAALAGGSRRAEKVESFVAGRRTASYGCSGRPASQRRIRARLLGVPVPAHAVPRQKGRCLSVGVVGNHGSLRIRHDVIDVNVKPELMAISTRDLTIKRQMASQSRQARADR